MSASAASAVCLLFVACWMFSYSWILAVVGFYFAGRFEAGVCMCFLACICRPHSLSPGFVGFLWGCLVNRLYAAPSCIFSVLSRVL